MDKSSKIRTISSAEVRRFRARVFATVALVKGFRFAIHGDRYRRKEQIDFPAV